MDARSALFDVFGDHVSRRGGWAPVLGLVRILDALEVAAPATRTAISRMAREGWLAPSERGGQRGYYATQRARRHLSEAYDRVYRLRPDWDRSWDMVVVDNHADRSARNRLARSMQYLGYAALAHGVWVAPRRSSELPELMTAEGATWHGFESRFDGQDAALAGRLWDLEGLARSYRAYLDTLAADQDRMTEGICPQEAFVMRTRIVHRWRLFLFNDPGLPQDVLPADWPGQEAAAQFEEAARRLLPLTDRFVDSCLGARVVSTAAATSAPPPSSRTATTPIRSTQGAPSR